MLARLERREVSGEMGIGVDRMPDLTCDDDPGSVAHTVADYAVLFCYADKDTLIRWKV